MYRYAQHVDSSRPHLKKDYLQATHKPSVMSSESVTANDLVASPLSLVNTGPTAIFTQKNNFEPGSAGVNQTISPTNLITNSSIGDVTAGAIHATNSVINNFYGGASPASVRRVEDNVPAEPAPEDAPFKELSASLEKELEILIKDFMSNAYDRLAPVSVP